MKKILLIGDSCKDIFQYGRCERLSPEAPVPVFIPTKRKVNGGMALNVYENIKALGAFCDIITNEKKTKKLRYVEENLNHTLLRVDSNNSKECMTSNIINSLNFDNYDAVVLSDYNKGFLLEEHIEMITNKHNLVILDTKKQLSDWCRNVSIIKINEKEYNKNKFFLKTKFTRDLIVTYGKKGAVLNHDEKIFEIQKKHHILDLSGAGDTFLAAFIVKYLENRNMFSSIRFANECASWVVTQKGVSIINLNKIQK